MKKKEVKIYCTKIMFSTASPEKAAEYVAKYLENDPNPDKRFLSFMIASDEELPLHTDVFWWKANGTDSLVNLFKTATKGWKQGFV